MDHDSFRLKILRSACGVSSFVQAWPDYKSVVDQKLGSNPGPQAVFDLGSNLSEIFRGNRSKRSGGQGVLSGGGTAWETLAVWYLNLVCWGTDVIATKNNASFVPRTIRDSLAVTIANRPTNTESDVMVFAIPGHLPGTPRIEDLDRLLRRNLTGTVLTVVQLKTNWNDNSQIPMLWDIVYNSYNSSNSKLSNVNVGINGVTPQNFKRFSYAFMTVPTNKPPKSSSVAVARVHSLSGGNYWGAATVPGVARSFKEFFQVNFGDRFPEGVQGHVDANMQAFPGLLDKFRNLSF